jgi:phosphate transport system substrate-binding protein
MSTRVLGWVRRTAIGALFSATALSASACTRTFARGDDRGASDGSATGSVPDKVVVSIKGSDTMVILAQRWAEEYMKASPGSTVQVSGGGSSTGITALINGSTDICESSRPMSDSEKATLLSARKQSVIETKVALDAVAIYVNESNPIHEISIAAIAQVYRGEITTWSALGGPDHAIVLYGRENNSGTYAYFKEHVLGGRDFAPAMQTLAGTAAVSSAVKGDVFGIGFGGVAYGDGVHALNVRKADGAMATSPSLETTQDGTYPLSRFLFLYTMSDAAPSTKKFVLWVRGPEGQRTITDVGYYPLPKKS